MRPVTWVHVVTGLDKSTAMEPVEAALEKPQGRRAMRRGINLNQNSWIIDFKDLVGPGFRSNHSLQEQLRLRRLSRRYLSKQILLLPYSNQPLCLALA